MRFLPVGDCAEYRGGTSARYLSASSGGAPLSVVAEYVKLQWKEARGRFRTPPCGVSSEVKDEFGLTDSGIFGRYFDMVRKKALGEGSRCGFLIGLIQSLRWPNTMSRTSIGNNRHRSLYPYKRFVWS